MLAGRWVLGAVLAPPGDPEADASRGQLVLIESMMHQFADLGLGSIVVPAHAMDQDELQQWRHELELSSRRSRSMRRMHRVCAKPITAVRTIAAYFPVRPGRRKLAISSFPGGCVAADSKPPGHPGGNTTDARLPEPGIR